MNPLVIQLTNSSVFLLGENTLLFQREVERENKSKTNRALYARVQGSMIQLETGLTLIEATQLLRLIALDYAFSEKRSFNVAAALRSIQGGAYMAVSDHMDRNRL